MRLNWFWFGTPGLHWHKTAPTRTLTAALLRAMSR